MSDSSKETDTTSNEPSQGNVAAKTTLQSALKAARDKLLDRSLRNRLVHTSIDSTRARQVRVIDALSTTTFSMLASGKTTTFVAARGQIEEVEDGAQFGDEYVPDGNGVSVHTDNKLQTRLTPEGLQKKLLSLYLEAQTLEEEQGVNVLYLALGFLEWREAKASDIQRYAPLVLLPVELVRDGARDRFKLKLRQEDILTNFSLQAWLKEQFSIELPELPDLEELASLSGYYSKVSAAIGIKQNWHVRENEIVLGFFSFAKFLLWRDLDPDNWPNADNLLTHDILNRILLRSQNEDDYDLPLINENERLDEKFPAKQLIHVTDADSSQAVAIEEALAGKNLVIQGPPGTGKSQTITNLIAAAVQRGKRVLFIAEKMAALNVVNSRLNKARLSSVCLELHSRKAAKTQVLEQIKTGMASPVPPQWPDAVFEEVDGNSRRLRQYSDALHGVGRNGFSPFQLIGKIALLRREGTPTPDFTLPATSTWTAETIHEVNQRLLRFVDRLQLSGTPRSHPWRGIGIDTPDVLAQDRLRPFIERYRDVTAAFADLAQSITSDYQLNSEPTLGELPNLIEALFHLADKPQGYDRLIANNEAMAQADGILAFLEAVERKHALLNEISGYQATYNRLGKDVPKKILARAWSLLTGRPKESDSFTLLELAKSYLEELQIAVPKLQGLHKLKLMLGRKVIPAAFATDWLETRQTIAANGKSIFRIFNSEYRRAVKSLRSVQKIELNTYFEKVEVLDALIEVSSLDEMENKHSGALGILGDQWDGPNTNWEQLEAAISWVELFYDVADALAVNPQEAAISVDAATSIWPSDLQKQLSILDKLSSFDELEQRIANDGVRKFLPQDWTEARDQLEGIRAALVWAVDAANFKPLVNLRAETVLARSGEAGARANEMLSRRGEFDEHYRALTETLQLDESAALDGASLTALQPSLFKIIAGQYHEDFSRITDWPPVRDDLAWLKEIECAEVATRVFDGRLETKHVVGTVLSLAYEAIWQSHRDNVQLLEKLHGDELTAFVNRFRIADQDRIRIASDQVARTHVDQKPAGSAGAVGILKDEIRKSRRLKPVRRLIDEAGEAIQRFKPVFLMSPLSVAQYLPPGKISFDLCVIDEASQVRPEDALGAIARCKQLVVVGDDKQLPPTNFFNRMISDDDNNDDDDEVDEGVRPAAVKDVESILNLCSRFPERMLKWHYRSEHPALIATSNRHFYRNQLMLPPSVVINAGDKSMGLQFVPVAKGGYERGKTATNVIEADEVAQAILDHARRFPEKSLGVGTFSVAQRDCVRDRIYHWAEKHKELDQFMRIHESGDPLFVKNLENIQGDERDVIFISVGYGHGQDGRLTQQFGPIGRDGGERRLNVLITRARQRCVVFSSIVAEDIKLDGLPKPGVVAFREFLKLAKDGFSDLPEITNRGFDSDFEESVAFAVRELGYEVHPQVGMAGFFVDLGIIDPRDSGRYMAGIECDGAAYHSSRYSRDRDRLRQFILESRGWKIHRVWSTDWFYRQDREMDKIKTFLKNLLNEPLNDPDEAKWPGTDELSTPEQMLSTPDIASGTEWRFAPYRYADIRWTGQADIEPHDLTPGHLADLVFKIVSTEHPIHTEEVARRLASAFGLKRAGNRIHVAALSGLKKAAREKRLIESKGFWRPVGDVPVVPRDRSGLPSASTVRKMEFICPTEMAAAAKVVLRENLALKMDELVTETARALGFARTGPDVYKAISKTITTHMADDIEEDHLGRMKLSSITEC